MLRFLLTGDREIAGAISKRPGSMTNNLLAAIANFFRSKGGGFASVSLAGRVTPEDLEQHCRILGEEIEEAKMKIERPSRQVDELVDTDGASACLVGDYTAADRALWAAVCMGFPSMVQRALDRGADASRPFECQSKTGDFHAVDLLFLAFLKSDEEELATHRSTLIDNDLKCCDAARLWNVRVGDAFNDEQMDGAKVAALLVMAGADPFRGTVIQQPSSNTFYGLPFIRFWQASEHMPHLVPLARERDLNCYLPIIESAPAARARL